MHDTDQVETGPTIDPRPPAELSALLAEHEIPEEEGALIWEIAKHGYYVSLSGPVEPECGDDTSEYQWVAMLLKWDAKAGEFVHQGMWHGQTARLSLALAVAWIIGQQAEAGV
jgi:hypothetical protein